MYRIFLTVAILALLAGCSTKERYGGADPEDDFTLILPLDNFVPCVEGESSETPTCEISRERFRTKAITSLTIIESEKPDNTRCCMTLKIDGVTSQHCITVTPAKCPKGLKKR